MKTLIASFFVVIALESGAQQKVLRDYGIEIGILKPGRHNAITDVSGVLVGHTTRIEGDAIRTGVTAILPHPGNIFQQKVPAAIFIGNGFGKLSGYTQVKELGNLETPIILTNTLSVPTAADALIDYTLSFSENKNVRSVNPVVGETNDGGLNDIQLRVVTKKDVLGAIEKADTGYVRMGNVGAGTGTVCFGFKGGIGTASRKLPEKRGGYTVGVLVQTNFGGVLQIAGVPVGVNLGQYMFRETTTEYKEDGSCMIVVATDAPLTSRNLERLASRAMLGLGRAGGNESNGSGDYTIAFSTAESVRDPYNSNTDLNTNTELRNDKVSILFQAVIEATEEAIINSLFAAETMTGRGGLTIESIPIEKTLEIIRQHNNKQIKN
ncbi:MAG: P1 family peptidase [Cyclobacteriaceae bacterium]|nr:P1 family peptidase [Cyclobacteriaceae bacterium]MDH5248031.1 P1 family peptidase [Cyclobacteriaceae bacterium]